MLAARVPTAISSQDLSRLDAASPRRSPRHQRRAVWEDLGIEKSSPTPSYPSATRWARVVRHLPVAASQTHDVVPVTKVVRLG